MRLRTFTASDMPSAMQMVREALGDNAVILATNSKAGSKQVTVTAAIEEEDEDYEQPPSGSKKLDTRSTIPEAKIDDIKFELQNILRFHNLPEIFVAKMLQKMTLADYTQVIENRRGSEELFRPALEKLLTRNFVYDPLRFTTQDMRIMLVGTAGIGKTLTIAKLATRLAMDKQSITVITTDTNRAGGIEQLQAFTNILDIDLYVAKDKNELISLLQAQAPRTRVLIDTAGCSPYNETDFAELKTIAKIENIEPVLVVPAGGDSLEAIDTAEIFRELPIRRILITRTDTTRRYGNIISIAVAHGLSFCNFSRSSSVTDALQLLDPTSLAQLLLKHKG